MRSGENGQHIFYAISKCISLNCNVFVLIQIYVSEGEPDSGWSNGLMSNGARSLLETKMAEFIDE